MKWSHDNLKAVLDHLYDGVYFVDQSRCITYWNQGAENLTGYTAEEVLGKHCARNLLRHVDAQGTCLCEDKCPLTSALTGNEVGEETVYLRHKAGHRLSVVMRCIGIRDENGVVIGAAEVFRGLGHDEVSERKLRELEKMALVDPLTGVANRRHVEVMLTQRLSELERYGWPFGLLFMDLDGFKNINDQYGHDMGDKVLRLVALSLHNSLRPFDFLGRWGGDEFIAIVVNVTQEQLIEISERARALVDQSNLHTDHGPVHITLSIGSTMAKHSESWRDLVQRADLLMYQSKTAGRNRVSIQTGDPAEIN